MDLSKDKKLRYIGLGYVGLPLAVEFGKVRRCRRFRYQRGSSVLLSGRGSTPRAKSSRKNCDRQDISPTRATLAICATGGVFTSSLCRRPIDSAKRPDLTLLEKGSATVGQGDPQGRRRDLRVDRLSGLYARCLHPDRRAAVGIEVQPGLFRGLDSPERINPGEQGAPLPTIKKVTSGSTPEAAEADR